VSSQPDFGALVGNPSRVCWLCSQLQYDATDKEAMIDTLMGCQVVVWDITILGEIDGCSWAVEMLKDKLETFETPKTFICLSNLMTWAKTLSADPVSRRLSYSVCGKLLHCPAAGQQVTLGRLYVVWPRWLAVCRSPSLRINVA
jgi:hypothetical protein